MDVALVSLLLVVDAVAAGWFWRVIRRR